VLAGFLFAIFAFLPAAADDPGDSIALDREGSQGAVAFDHAAHVKVPHDPLSPYPAPETAGCAGCHHTRNSRDVIQLAKCEGCHGPEGDRRNPKGLNFDEENRKTAYHQMCIGCHANLARAAASAKTGVYTGPVDCVDCHKPAARGGG